MVIMNDLEQPMLLYMIYFEKFRKIMQAANREGSFK